jgi:hypothetical protein
MCKLSTFPHLSVCLPGISAPVVTHGDPRPFSPVDGILASGERVVEGLLCPYLLSSSRA